MQKEVTVSIKFSEEELAKFIGDHTVPLDDNETYEVISSYPALGEFEFKIVELPEANLL